MRYSFGPGVVSEVLPTEATPSMVAGSEASLAAFLNLGRGMSDPPTICSLPSSSPTVCYPLIPM